MPLYKADNYTYEVTFRVLRLVLQWLGIISDRSFLAGSAICLRADSRQDRNLANKHVIHCAIMGRNTAG